LILLILLILFIYLLYKYLENNINIIYLYYIGITLATTCYSAMDFLKQYRDDATARFCFTISPSRDERHSHSKADSVWDEPTWPCAFAFRSFLCCPISFHLQRDNFVLGLGLGVSIGRVGLYYFIIFFIQFESDPIKFG
jgi:hypothetical protein